MKKLIGLLVFTFLFTFHQTQAQDEVISQSKETDSYPNYIKKGNFSVSASFSKINKTSASQNIYATYGGEVGALYYPLNRVGLETTVSGQQYNLQKAKNAEAALLDNKNLLLISERLRYNFYEKSHCAAAFLQTGYSYGSFQHTALQKIHRWEIISLGATGSFPRQVIPFLDFEYAFALTKDNFHNGITWQYKLGLRYNFGH